MIAETSRWEQLKAHWPYLLVLAPLADEWLKSRGGATWLTLTADSVVVLTTLVMVAVIQAQRRRLEEASITDRLTGLFNSRHLRGELDRQVALAHRTRSPLSMIFMDLDRFKEVNDRWGHEVGDRLLRQAAQALLAETRAHVDLCFRFGGDEFLVLCPQTARSDAAAIAERVLRARVASEEAGGEPVTMSLGVVELRRGETPREFLRRADAALYRVKQGGRNAIGYGDGA
jgi:diguanylate cyclase (GGDEF)-like protein